MSGIIGGGENSSGIIGQHGLVPQKWSAARLTQSAAFTLAAGSWTLLEYNVTVYDTLGEISGSPLSRFTATYAGKYHCSAVLRSADVAWTANQGWYVSIRINGTEQVVKRTTAKASFTDSQNVSVSGDFALQPTDYVTLYGLAQRSGTTNTTSGLSYNNVSFHRVA